MAGEIQFTDDTGFTDYVNLTNTVGQWYNTVGAAFEAFNAANFADYDIAAAEYGTSGVYRADMPALAAGAYNVTARRRAGGAPAQSDRVVGTGTLGWDGTVVRDQVDAVAVSGDVTAANNLETMLDGTGGQNLTLGRLVISASAAGAGLFVFNDGGPAVHFNSSGGRGLTIETSSTDNEGMAVIGNGAGVGARFQGGATGSGLHARGGSSGGYGLLATGQASDGLRAVSEGSNGHGMALQGNGTGDGLNSTGGVSAGGDGIAAIAGGGVPIRGDLTGSITGSLSGSVGSVAGNVDGSVASVLVAGRQAIADSLLARNAAGGSDGGKTVAFYIQGGLPKVTQNAAGTTFEIFGADGVTSLQTGTIGRLATTVGGIEDVTPA